jgi:hypothetical protein
MTVIFDGNTKNYTILDKYESSKIELIQVQNGPSDQDIALISNDYNNESKEKIIIKNNRPKTYRKKKLTKENQEFLSSLKTGSGFKIITSNSVQ